VTATRTVSIGRLLVAAAALVGVVAVTMTPAGASTPDETPPEPFDFVADAGDYQTGFQVASPYNSIYVSWQPSSDDGSAVTYEVTIDGETARVVTDASTYQVITKRIDVPDGTHVVAVTAVDAAGNRRASTHSLDVVIDKVSPHFTSFPLLLLRKGQVTEQGYPMRYTWTGDDVGTGLAKVRIGPDEQCCFEVAATRTSYDFAVAPRSQMAWRIFLYDGVGRKTRTIRDGYVAPVSWSDTHRAGDWHAVDDSSALDGSEWVSKNAGDRFRVEVEGRSVAWVTTTSPGRGKADVLVDGRVVDTVDLTSTTRRPARVVWTAKLPLGSSATVTIVNRSPAQRPTIGVDALLVQGLPG
jgi:Bacterial Ig-like domain